MNQIFGFGPVLDVIGYELEMNPLQCFCTLPDAADLAVVGIVNADLLQTPKPIRRRRNRGIDMQAPQFLARRIQQLIIKECPHSVGFIKTESLQFTEHRLEKANAMIPIKSVEDRVPVQWPNRGLVPN